MKKIIKIVLVTILIFNCKVVLSQNIIKKDTLPPAADSGLSKEEKTSPYIELKNGKLVLNKNGSQIPVQKETPLKNGDVVLPNGTVKTTDGVTIQLKEGDRVYMNGLIIKRK